MKKVIEPIFGKWYIEEKIGSGAFGTVYKIKRESFGKVYYSALKEIQIPQDKDEIKALRNELGDDKSVSDYYTNFVQDFAKEIELMSALKGNSNIVSFEDHDFIQHEDGFGWTILIRMELLTPFIDYQSSHTLSTSEILQMGIDMCTALETCENKNIIHRDIKPDNIFLSDDGKYKLGDFGIARELEKTTGGLSKKGTYTYMAPEVYLGKPYNNTVDIYSLGIVLYKLLNHNRAPFLPDFPSPVKYSDREEAMKKRMSGDKLPAIKDAPKSVNEIIKKACEFNSADRYQSASELKRALADALDCSEQVLEDNVNINEASKTENISYPSENDNALSNDVTTDPFDSVKDEGTSNISGGVDEENLKIIDTTVSAVPLENVSTKRDKNKSVKKTNSKDTGSILTKVNVIVCSIALLFEIVLDILFFANYGLIGINNILTIVFCIVLIICLVLTLTIKKLPLPIKIIITVLASFTITYNVSGCVIWLL